MRRLRADLRLHGVLFLTKRKFLQHSPNCKKTRNCRTGSHGGIHATNKTIEPQENETQVSHVLRDQLRLSRADLPGVPLASKNPMEGSMVGTGRFELPTPRTPSECSTRLSHVPTQDEPARASRFQGSCISLHRHRPRQPPRNPSRHGRRRQFSARVERTPPAGPSPSRRRTPPSARRGTAAPR